MSRKRKRQEQAEAARIERVRKMQASKQRSPLRWVGWVAGVALSGVFVLFVVNAFLSATPSFEQAWENPGALADCAERLELPLPSDLNTYEMPVARAVHEAFVEACEAPAEAEAVGRLGMTFHAHDMLEYAAAVYDRASGLAPGDHRWWYYRGKVAGDQGDSLLAIQCLRVATRHARDYAVGWLGLGSLYLEQSDAEQAERAFRAYVELRPDESLGYTGLAMVARLTGDDAAAYRHLQEAVRRPPPDRRVHQMLGLLERSRGLDAEARRQLDHARRLDEDVRIDDPLMADVQRLNRTIAADQERLFEAIDTERYNDALKLAEAIVDRRPEDHAAYVNLAGVYRLLKDYPAAERAARRAVELNPGAAQCHATLSAVLLDAGRDDEALEQANRAIRLDPMYPQAWSLRGRAHRSRGESAETIHALSEAVRLQPDETGDLQALVETLLAEERYEEAVVRLRQYVTLAPQDQKAREHLEMLQRVVAERASGTAPNVVASPPAD